MAVIPGTSNPVPDGGNTSDLGGVSWMQDVTEGSVRQNAYNQVFPSMQGAKESLLGNLLGGFFSVLTGIFTGALSAIPSWFPTGAQQFAQQVRDGQLDLNDRTDLLSPLLDYCSVYAPPNVNGHARFGTGIMPFTEQIGPAQNVTIASPGRLVLGDKGLWDVRAQVVPSWTGLTNPSDIRLGIRVLYPAPNGQVFSQQTMIEKTTNVTSFTVVSSVVVPDAGYMVEVYVEQMDSNRGILGGPKWSRLTVQHISRDVQNKTGAESSTDNPSQNGPS